MMSKRTRARCGACLCGLWKGAGHRRERGDSRKHNSSILQIYRMGKRSCTYSCPVLFMVSLFSPWAPIMFHLHCSLCFSPSLNVWLNNGSLRLFLPLRGLVYSRSLTTFQTQSKGKCLLTPCVLYWSQAEPTMGFVLPNCTCILYRNVPDFFP